MYLLQEEAQMFYKLWLSLLDYTNRKYKINIKLKELKSAKNINPQDLGPIRDKLWEDKSLIDEYLNENKDSLSEEELEIIEGWKRRITGKFILFKYLKKYTVFMATKGDIKLYGVVGISNPIENMFPAPVLPIYVEGTLIPFKGKIIYDSLLLPYNVTFGGGMKKGFNEEYRNSKAKYGIITTM